MDNARPLLIFGNLFLIIALIFTASHRIKQNRIKHGPETPTPEVPFIQEPEQPKDPQPPNISNPIPSHQSYDEITQQLQEWHAESPDMTEVGTYGKTSGGKDIYYMRLGNLYRKGNPKVLLYACIHGNEPISTSTSMAFCGTLLSKYGRDEEVTKLLNTREIYLDPVVSPDSYPHSRWIDGVDPNRDFPSMKDPNRVSVPPIKALQEFHLKHKFKAVLCGHSSGRWFLHPWSEVGMESKHHQQYVDIISRMMATAPGYKRKQSAYFYSNTIVGGGCDWFYRHGCFAITPEFGTHQRKSSDADIREELDRLYEAFILYIREAPLVEVPVIGFDKPSYSEASTSRQTAS